MIPALKTLKIHAKAKIEEINQLENLLTLPDATGSLSRRSSRRQGHRGIGHGQPDGAELRPVPILDSGHQPATSSLGS